MKENISAIGRSSSGRKYQNSKPSQTRSKPHLKTKISFLKIVFLSFILLAIFMIAKSVYMSAFFQKKDRVNIVVEDKSSEFFSFGLDDGVNYYVSFFPDLETIVPGGYGY
jgi:hypothetical protein